MTLGSLLDDLKPIDFRDRSSEQQSQPVPSIADSVGRMIVLAEKAGKLHFRTTESSTTVATQVRQIAETLEKQVAKREADLEAERKRTGELTDQVRDLALCIAELEDLGASAAHAAARELGPETAAKFAKLQQEMLKIAKRADLEPLAVEGLKYDPDFHEAIDQVSREEGDTNVILEVVKQGYRYRGTVLRIAKVVVTI